MITSIVLIETERGQTEQTADALLDIAGVFEVYSVTGEYDLVAMVRVRKYEEMVEIVPRRVARVPGVKRTHTLMAFQHYSRHDLEAVWGLGIEDGG